MIFWQLRFERVKDRNRYSGARELGGETDYIRDASGRITYRYNEHQMRKIIDRKNAALKWNVALKWLRNP